MRITPIPIGLSKHPGNGKGHPWQPLAAEMRGDEHVIGVRLALRLQSAGRISAPRAPGITCSNNVATILQGERLLAGIKSHLVCG